MRIGYLLILSAAVLAAGCKHQPRASTFQEVATATAPAFDTSDYLLHAGDSIDIKFFYQSDLNESVTIRPDGKISLQLIDEIHAAGMTPTELRRTLFDRYRGVLRNPEVAVVLREASRQRVYVAGEVVTPGLLALDADLTALQAIMQAGGVKATALTENVVILRNQGNDRPMYITLDLRSDLEQPGQRHDIPLRPRDIVFVPKTTIARMNDFVDQYIDKLIPVQRSVGVFYDLSGPAGR